MKKEKLSTLIRKLRMVFNRYIVLKDKRCVTCGSTKELQASHFYSFGRHSNVRFDEENVHCQCCGCHMEYHRGCGRSYVEWMQKNVDIDNLARKAKISEKKDSEWYHKMIDKYKNLCIELSR